MQAALTEPAATAMHALNMSMRALVRPLPECRLLVLGGGAIGMLAALLLRHYGVDQLGVAEVNPLCRASLERRPLAAGPAAFADLRAGRLATVKVVLEPAGSS